MCNGKRCLTVTTWTRVQIDRFFFTFFKKKQILIAFIIILAIFFFNYFVFFCFFCYFFIVSAMSYAGAHSNFSLLDLRHRAVGPWSTTTTQFLTSIWTVQDGQVAISRCWLPRASHAFVWQREDSLYGALQFWQSATERRYFWWLGRRMKFPRPQMAQSASAYWLAIRERRFSTRSGSMCHLHCCLCLRSWFMLSQPPISIGANFLQPSP